MARLAITRDDLERALELVRSAPEAGSETDRALEELIAVALERDSQEIALAALSRLQSRDPEAPLTRALALRAADAGPHRLADRRAIDRQVRQLLADIDRSAAAGAEVRPTRVCEQLEALYRARFEAEAEPAHQIDALLAQRSVCTREPVHLEVLHTLGRRAREEEEAGHHETAVAFYEQVVEIDRRGGVGPADQLEAARRATHRLLWPTYLERAQHRFASRFAEDWAARDLYAADTGHVRIELPVAVPEGCPSLDRETCETLWAAASDALRARLGELALESAEMGPGQLDPTPQLGPLAPELVSQDGTTAYFAVAVPLERLIRAVYDTPAAPTP